MTTTEMKTYKEVYDALLAAGAKTGDVVLTNKGSVRMLQMIDTVGSFFTITSPLVFVAYNTSHGEILGKDEWPVSVTRLTVADYGLPLTHSWTITYPVPPQPLTLEERVTQLEKDLAQYSDHMTRILNDHRKD